MGTTLVSLVIAVLWFSLKREGHGVGQVGPRIYSPVNQPHAGVEPPPSPRPEPNLDLFVPEAPEYMCKDQLGAAASRSETSLVSGEPCQLTLSVDGRTWTLSVPPLTLCARAALTLTEEGGPPGGNDDDDPNSGPVRVYAHLYTSTLPDQSGKHCADLNLESCRRIERRLPLWRDSSRGIVALIIPDASSHHYAFEIRVIVPLFVMYC